MGNSPAMANALAKLGEHFFLDWTQYIEVGATDALHKELIRASNEINPDITFLHIQRPGVIDGETAALLKGFIINYTYDVALPIPEWYYEVGANINLTIFCDENGVWDFNSKGLNSEFLITGYDDSIFKPTGATGDYGDIVFLGNHYSSDQNFNLTQMRFDMVQYLKEMYGDSFKVYGNGWTFNDGNLMYREEKEAACYRSCKLAINISHFDLERYTSDRILRIMGSGAFCLSKWYPGIENDFKDGVHLRVWKDFNELKTLIDYYLAHPDERLAIAQTGQKYVNETATWEIKMKTIIDMANNARLSKEYKSRVVKVQQQIYIKDPATAVPQTVTVPQTPVVQQNIVYPEPDPSIPLENQNNVIQPSVKPVEIVPVKIEHNKIITCINDYFDKIYCINLDRRPDKWEKSKAEFEKNNLIVERVSAIDGNNLGETRISKWELGCVQSHLFVLRDMLAKGYEKILVFEDDIEFIPNVQKYFVDNVRLIPANWQMLYFGGNHINPPVPVNNVISKISRTYTTASYGITKNTAQGIINRSEKRPIGQTQIDVMYSEIHHGSNCYTFSPKIAWQRPGWSDIQNGNQDYMGIVK